MRALGSPPGSQYLFPFCIPGSGLRWLSCPLTTESWTVMASPSSSWTDHYFLFLLPQWWFRVRVLKGLRARPALRGFLRSQVSPQLRLHT